MAATSAGSGGRVIKRRNIRVAIAFEFDSLSKTSFDKALAISKYISSLSNVSACKGVLLRLRRATQFSPDGASKTVKAANGAVRLVKV